MKIKRFPILLTLLILGSILLSACTGGAMVNNWPGLSVSGNTIYVAHQGSIYAINADTGTMAWSFPQKPDASKPFFAAPTISDDLIVAGNYGHMLYGITKNGTEAWSFDSTNGNFAGSPLIVGDTILAPCTNNSLYALSTQGMPKWTFETGNALWTSPVSDGKVVYLPALDHHLYALNLADGSLIWKKDLGSALLSSPILTSDGTLYVDSMNGEIFALKSTDGTVVWQVKSEDRIWAPLLLHNDVLYTGNIKGQILAVSAADGKITWQTDAGSPVIGGGALLKDGVAFPTEAGALVAFSFDGQKLWNQTVNGKLYTTPVVYGDNLIVAVTEGADKLLASAFASNGVPAWTFTTPK